MTLFLNLNDHEIFNHLELIKFLAKNQDQHVILNTNYEGGCLESLGLYKLLDCFRFKSVTIVTGNIVEHHPDYQIRVHHSSFRFFYVPDTVDYSQYHTWNQEKVFGALYNRATWNRIGLASHLYANHLDKSAINFRANPHDNIDRQLFEMETLFNYDITSAKNFLANIDQFPVRYTRASSTGYETGVSTMRHTDLLAESYKDFLIDIVSETFVQGRNFFPTEKTVRPMLLKKPFIIMGPRCNLIHLRQMGFRTFNEFWNEDYDGYDATDKYLRILKVIDTIAAKSTAQLEQMYVDMQPILTHNYNLLLEKKFSKDITYVK
jgi:hypothetical protein